VAAPAPRLGATELPYQPICKSTTVSRLHLQGRVQVCGPPTKTSSFESPPSRGMARPVFRAIPRDRDNSFQLGPAPCAADCSARPTSSLFIARSGGRKSCAGAAAGARAWARAAGLGGGEPNPTRPRSATIIPAPRFGRGGGIAGADDSALRQRADLQALSAILLESWNELSRGTWYENDAMACPKKCRRVASSKRRSPILLRRRCGAAL